MKKNIFPVRAVKCGRRLSREAMKSPFLETAQNLTGQGPDPSGPALSRRLD